MPAASSTRQAAGSPLRTVRRGRPPGPPGLFASGQPAQERARGRRTRVARRSLPSRVSVSGRSGAPSPSAQGRRIPASRRSSVCSHAAQSSAWKAESRSSAMRGAGEAAAARGHGAAPPYSHTPFAGSWPRAARWTLTGCSYQAICISLTRRRQGRAAASCVHQAFNGCPVTAAGLAVGRAMPWGTPTRQRKGCSGATSKGVSSNSGRAASNSAAPSAAGQVQGFGRHQAGAVGAQGDMGKIGDPDALVGRRLGASPQGPQARADRLAGAGWKPACSNCQASKGVQPCACGSKGAWRPAPWRIQAYKVGAAVGSSLGQLRGDGRRWEAARREGQYAWAGL